MGKGWVVIMMMVVVCSAQLVAGAESDDKWEWDGDKLKCGKNKPGYYVYPNDPTRYVKCIFEHPSGELRAYVHKCPPDSTYQIPRYACLKKDGSLAWHNYDPKRTIHLPPGMMA